MRKEIKRLSVRPSERTDSIYIPNQHSFSEGIERETPKPPAALKLTLHLSNFHNMQG